MNPIIKKINTLVLSFCASFSSALYIHNSDKESYKEFQDNFLEISQLDLNAISDDCYLIDSQWALTLNDKNLIIEQNSHVATLNGKFFNLNFGGKDYKIDKIIDFPYINPYLIFNDIERAACWNNFRLLRLKKPVLNIKPIQRIRFLDIENKIIEDVYLLKKILQNLQIGENNKVEKSSKTFLNLIGETIIEIQNLENSIALTYKNPKTLSESSYFAMANSDDDKGTALFTKSVDSKEYQLAGLLDRTNCKNTALEFEQNQIVDKKMYIEKLMGWVNDWIDHTILSNFFDPKAQTLKSFESMIISDKRLKNFSAVCKRILSQKPSLSSDSIYAFENSTPLIFFVPLNNDLEQKDVPTMEDITKKIDNNRALSFVQGHICGQQELICDTKNSADGFKEFIKVWNTECINPYEKSQYELTSLCSDKITAYFIQNGGTVTYKTGSGSTSRNIIDKIQTSRGWLIIIDKPILSRNQIASIDMMNTPVKKKDKSTLKGGSRGKGKAPRKININD